VLANHHTCIHVEAANDSLKPGDTLNYTDTTTVYSKKGKYSLAFGSPTRDDNRYLFVFNVNKNVQVWVSDRNQPVHKDSVVLSLNAYTTTIIVDPPWVSINQSQLSII